MTEPLISNVSDTARWVAVYRADESARPDAHFDDPLANRVAGARGRAIAAAMPRIVRNGWTFVARTKSIDDLISSSLANGCDRVLNLAAGFDCRPYRLDLPETLEWIEADLPAMIDEKEELLADQTPRCRLSRHRVDLADPEVRRTFLADATRGAKNALVITEGLLIYLDADQARSLASDLQRDEIRWWITDLTSPGVLKFMARTMGDTLVNAPMKFAVPNGAAYFEDYGWKAVDIKDQFSEAARLRRLPWLMRPFTVFPTPDPRNPKRANWSAVVRYYNS